MTAGLSGLAVIDRAPPQSRHVGRHRIRNLDPDDIAPNRPDAHCEPQETRAALRNLELDETLCVSCSREGCDVRVRVAIEVAVFA